MTAAVSEPALEVHDLTVAYHKKRVLWGVDFAIPPGVMVAVVGPNGAGKSTLIKGAMGLLPLSSGWVEVFGKPLEETRHRVGYVPQRGEIDWDFPVSVMDVVLMGRYGKLGLLKWPRREDREAARAALDRLRMLPYANRQIANLSGGQQQRVFLARALAQESDLYFMDEPFAGVDAATEEAIVDLMRGLKEQGKTLIVVHHDLATVRDYFDWVVLLNMRLVACGPTEQVFTPDLVRTAYGGQLTLLAEVGEALRKDTGLSEVSKH